jgi:hypothetical protein
MKDDDLSLRRHYGFLIPGNSWQAYKFCRIIENKFSFKFRRKTIRNKMPNNVVRLFNRSSVDNIPDFRQKQLLTNAQRRIESSLNATDKIFFWIW